MISSFSVGIILTLIWGIAFFLIYKKPRTYKLYIGLLIIMGIAPLFLSEEYFNPYTTLTECNAFNIVIFAFLLLIAAIPWVTFDRWFRRVECIEIVSEKVKVLKMIMIFNILLSLYAILYALPYAIYAMSMSATEIRGAIKEASFYPPNIFTTICVGTGFLAPIQLLLFFISFLSEKFKRYRILLGACCCTYIVTNLPNSGRDGMIFIPLTFIILYIVFRKSLPKNTNAKIKNFGKFFGLGIAALLLIISLQRFYFDDTRHNANLDPTVSLVAGTWGYFYQQPFIFNEYVERLDYPQGLSHRLPLLQSLLGEKVEDFSPSYPYEWSFGTMFAEWYAINNNWDSLIYCTLFFILSFYFSLKFVISRKNASSIIGVFSIYIYYLITGLFYFRLSAFNITILYILLTSVFLFAPKFLKVKYKSSSYKAPTWHEDNGQLRQS